tara:strand:+ start:2162 stop:2926 length:765 start_codon:yes stop_codon:yes gene_type:complete
MLHYDVLKDKNVLITGVTGGVGANIAKELLNRGCNLFITGRNRIKLKEISSELSETLIVYGGGGSSIVKNTVYHRPCDLSNTSNVLSLIADVREVFDNIDILVNSAGIFPVKDFVDLNLDDYNKCINVNLTAPFLLINEFVKEMIKNKWGRIINIASSSAYSGSPKTSIYCASKHALLGMSRSIYQEFKSDNVRVLTISPGSIQTEMGRRVEELGQDYDTFINPEELAEYVVYISSFDKEMISEEVRLNRLIIR